MGQSFKLVVPNALKNGMNLDLLFEQLKDIRSKTQVPLVLMGYYNQVLQYGLEPFCKMASEVGVDGLILPDLPLDEFKNYVHLFSSNTD